MLLPRTSNPSKGNAVAVVGGGSALKRAIRVARARSEYTSDMALAIAAGVHYDTLMNWYADRTTPRPAEVRKVARVLGIPYGDLMAAYEGREPEPVPLQDAIRELVDELRQSRHADDQRITRLVDAISELARHDNGRPRASGE